MQKEIFTNVRQEMQTGKRMATGVNMLTLRRMSAIVLMLIMCMFTLPDRSFLSAREVAAYNPDDLVSVTITLQQDSDPRHGQSIGIQKAGSETVTHANLRFGNYTYRASPIVLQEIISTYARSFVYFPLPSLSVTPTITRATLALYVKDWFPDENHAIPFALYPATEPWTEETISWDSMPAVDRSLTATTVISNATGWYQWDVTEFVREWYAGSRPNYGVMIAAYPAPDAMNEWAVEAYGRQVLTPTLAPRLEISYLRPPFHTYLPLVTSRYATYPDLIVQWMKVSKSQVRICLTNVGDAPVVDDFWVDLYIDPHPVPTAPNQVWHQLCDQGLVWGVTQDLAPGDTIILEINGDYFDPSRSHFTGEFTADMLIYIQVDSANLETNYGGVLEKHEALGEPYNNIYGPVTPTLSSASDTSTRRLEQRLRANGPAR